MPARRPSPFSVALSSPDLDTNTVQQNTLFVYLARTPGSLGTKNRAPADMRIGNWRFLAGLFNVGPEPDHQNLLAPSARTRM